MKGIYSTKIRKTFLLNKRIHVYHVNPVQIRMRFEKTNPIVSFSVLRSAVSVWIPAFAGMTNNKYPRLSALICG